MRLPEKLSPAEQRLLEDIKNGEPADYTVGDPARYDPAQGTVWGTERTVRAAVIRALCIGADPNIKIDPKGIRISGARIIDILDLEAITIAVPLRLQSCYIEQQPLLEKAKIKLLDLSS